MTGSNEPRNRGDAWEARRVIRTARMATLATLSAEGPGAALVTPAFTADLTGFLLLSDLSAHTRDLRRDPRCCLLLSLPPAEPNPQTAPRVAVSGQAAVVAKDAHLARYLAVHPYAEFYAGFGDFHLFAFRPVSAQFVGGFARAAKLDVSSLLPDGGAVARVERAEIAILSHCNADHRDALALVARAAGGVGDGWRMTACDTDGCDLATPERSLRVSWSGEIDGPDAVRRELILLAQAARAARADG